MYVKDNLENLYLYSNVLWSNEYSSRHLFMLVSFKVAVSCPLLLSILNEEIMKKQ